MMDGHRLLKFAYKVQRKGFCEDVLLQSSPNVMEMTFSLLHDDFNFIPSQASLVLQNISKGIELEIQLAKVVIVLCYCGFKRHNLPPLDTKTEVMIASMFQFVEDDADGLSLNKGLDQFLTKGSVMTFSTSGSESSSPLTTIYKESPIFSRFQNPPRVQFQEVFSVACSSGSSPVHNVMNTPHFRLKRLREKLIREEDLRDELENELANQISIISEKEGLISQLQHRVERMLREQGELEKDHKAAVLELQEKNKSLLHRVHEVLKQCQDLKTDNSQKEKKIDELTEENGTLSAQVRNVFFQLARAEEEVCKLTVAHESAQTEWRDRKELLQKELSQAVTHKECLSEQVLILQGKISVFEDELKKAQSQERGEVLGPIMEGLNKIENLQTQIQDLLEQISVKDEDLRNLRNIHESVDNELKLVKQQNAEINAMIKSDRKEHEETVEKLQQELRCAASAASEKQEQMLVLSAEVTSLKEQICRYSENEAQDSSVLNEKLTSLQNQLTQMKQSELQQKLSHQETLREKSEEFEKTVKKLQSEISALYSEKETQISALKAEMEDRQRSRAQLELKLKKQNSSILDLKTIGRQFQQQNKELMEKLEKTFQQLQHYNAKIQEARETNKSLERSLQARQREINALKMEREQAEAKMRFAEMCLKEQRNMTDDTKDMRLGESLRVPEKQQDTITDCLEFNLDGSFNVNTKETHSIGAESESEDTADDWMRIAELQARNKACLPHMKSSYPLESGPNVGVPALTLTDEDLRMGDPKETIRRAALHILKPQDTHTSHTRKRRGAPLDNLNTSEPKQSRQSVMFTIANTPKKSMSRGRKDACKFSSLFSRALRPAATAANSRSPQISNNGRKVEKA
ncbi:uncharacterized protein isoform X2 [Danio rerio]